MARKSAVKEAQHEPVFEEKPLPGFVRVNLLPELVLERAAARRTRTLAISLILISLMLILAWRLYLQLGLQKADEELLQAQTTATKLQAEIAKYAEIPVIFKAAEQGQEALTIAMGQEVRWSFLLNQLSFSTPEGVKLATVTGKISDTGPVQTSPGDALPPKVSVGQMTFGGTSSSYERVAAWLDTLEGLQDYAYPFMTQASKDAAQAAPSGPTAGGAAATPVGGELPFKWDSLADLSPNALSGRYSEAIPSQPGATGTKPGQKQPGAEQPSEGGQQ